jgi:hypothetical protein
MEDASFNMPEPTIFIIAGRVLDSRSSMKLVKKIPLKLAMGMCKMGKNGRIVGKSYLYWVPLTPLFPTLPESAGNYLMHEPKDMRDFEMQCCLLQDKVNGPDDDIRRAVVDYGYSFEDEKGSDGSYNWIVKFETPESAWSVPWTDPPRTMDIVYDTERGPLDRQFVRIGGHWIFLPQVMEQALNDGWDPTTTIGTAEHSSHELNFVKKTPASWAIEWYESMVEHGKKRAGGKKRTGGGAK